MSDLTSRVWQYIRQPWRLAVFFKRIGLFIVFVVVIAITYWWASHNLRSASRWVVSAVIFWLAIAYYALPQIHRLLSRIYLPNYFIGRTRTVDGLLADPINLALRGTEAQLIKALHKAGWQQADPLTLKSGFHIGLATLRRRSYDKAPVSDMFVFGEKQNFAFQKEVDGNPAKRHHVRFWKVPKDGYLPGGYKVDWVGAATYDDAVGFSLFTLQITHSIDGDVDAERDFVVKTLQKGHRVHKVLRIDHFFPGYRHRNGGGDTFFTDGSMVIVDLKKGLLR